MKPSPSRPANFAATDFDALKAHSGIICLEDLNQLSASEVLVGCLAIQKPEKEKTAEQRDDE